MTIVMSRQNKLQGGHATAALYAKQAEDEASWDPYTQWPAGVRRYGQEREFNLALIPVFDMANHAPVRALLGGQARWGA